MPRTTKFQHDPEIHDHSGIPRDEHPKKMWRRRPLRGLSKDETIHPFTEQCDKEFKFTTFGSRSKADVLLGVDHGTQGITGVGGARHTAQYFSGGSTTAGTAGVSDVNSFTIHTESASMSFWTKVQWMLGFNRRMLRRMAHRRAHRLRDLDIPNVFWTTRMLNKKGSAFIRDKRKMGYTFHRCLSDSNLSSSTHQDPWSKFSPLNSIYKRLVTHFYENPELSA